MPNEDYTFYKKKAQRKKKKEGKIVMSIHMSDFSDE